MSLDLIGNYNSHEITLRELRHDGGYDFHRISTSDLVNAWTGGSGVPWREIAFSLSEATAYYAALGKDISNAQIIRWAYAVLLLSSAIRCGYGDLETEIIKIIDVLYMSSNRISPEIIVLLLTSTLCPAIRPVAPVPPGGQ